MNYSSQPTRPIVMGTNGMVASGHPLASQAAARVLQDGGNAIDAAVTAAGVLAVTKPEANSVGGDMFLIYYDAASDRVESMNGSGRAPAAMTIETLAASRGVSVEANPAAYTSFTPAKGPHAASVPGVVRGWADALGRYGTVSLEHALQPAICYAAQGFPVSVRLSRALTMGAGLLQRCKASSQAYLKNGQEPYRPGELLKLPDLARSLQLIAREGPEAFYTGELGQRIVEAHQEDGGFFTEADFARQESVFGEPLSVDYHGYTVYNQRPVSMGTVLLEELKIVDGFDLAALPWDSADRLHLLIEAKKLAFVDAEEYLTDPEWFEVPLDGLLSDEYAASRRSLIDRQRAADYGAGDPSRYGKHTTYMCVADGKGNCVSWIQTLFHGFGSGWMAPGTGILLNDRMNGFSSNPQHVNRVEGGKRTAHTLNAPMVFKSGKPCLVFGTPGGYGQVQSNLQMLTSFIDHGFDVQSMVEAPRWVNEEGRSVTIETRYAAETLDGLRRLGHELTPCGAWHDVMGGAQAIHINQETGALEGAADPRREGYAIGF
jgi:gamma-glutamyltranspeptidase / glutathione hydrolase